MIYPISIPDLTELDLHHNEIASLPSGLGRLSKLTTLYLAYNRIVALPSDVRMPALRELHLANNHVKVIFFSGTVLMRTRSPKLLSAVEK